MISLYVEPKKWYKWIYLQNGNRITDVENKLMVTRGDCCCSSVAKSYLTLWPHGLQHTRLPCASLSPRVCSNSCPLSRWCHPTISSSVSPFTSCLQSFPASRSFPMSQFFASGGKSIGASALILPVNTQCLFSCWPFSMCQRVIEMAYMNYHV